MSVDAYLKPKVLMVSTEYPPITGGVGRYTSNLVKALKEIGVEVYVLCNEKGNGDFFGLEPLNENNSQVILDVVNTIKPDIAHIQLEHGLYGFKQVFKKNLNKPITNIEDFYEKCPIPIVTTFHSAYPFKQWLRISKLLYRQQNDILNTKSINPLDKIKEYWKALSTYYAFNKANKIKLKKSNANIVFSEYLANLISDGEINTVDTTNSDLEKDKIFVIYHGAEPILSVPPEKIQARRKFNLPIDRKIGLLFGFATNTKGWDILNKLNIPHNWTIVINQSKNLYGSGKSTPIRILDDPDPKIKQDSNNKDQKIINLNQGFLSDNDLSTLFYSCDIAILPYTVTSGSGVLFDALAHGLPFVATNLGFFKEFEKKGLGITVKRKPCEFERAIKRLEVNYSDYVRKVEEFKSELKWTNIARQHLKIYIKSMSEEKKSTTL